MSQSNLSTASIDAPGGPVGSPVAEPGKSSRGCGAALHVAVIMDGNGRWACRRGLERAAGHQEGAKAVRRVVQAALDIGVGAAQGTIGTLTLFAFSGDNWQRPEGEVAALMRVFEDYLVEARESYPARGIRVNVIGRRDRLELPLLAAVEAVERATACGRRLHLRLAIDYSARDSIVRAARIAGRNGYAGEHLTREAFASLLAEANHVEWPAPEVDLLIRSGGEQRLSDCLLWEIAYAEIVFSERLWPDFTGADLAAALEEFHRRERRYGRIPQVVAGS